MIFSNNGERCTAGSRILVQKSDLCRLRAALRRAREAHRVGDPLDEQTIVGPMISPAHLAKVRSYIELGPKEGATLLCGGLDRVPDAAGAWRKGNFVCPPCLPTSTTACASRRTRSSARWPA
jgi:5-carboxymethyl-2-hydroxymuconic-semialdehyde dehydrogenase